MKNPLTGRVCVCVLMMVALAATAVSTGCQPAARSDLTYAPSSLPRLVDLGATACIPCKVMAGILEDLKRDFPGRLQVEFINVNEQPEVAKPYGVQLIPTQIFISASGHELFRHTGVYSEKDIVAKWKDLGVDLDAPAAAGPQ
jgi:thioredoxin 1